IQRMDSVVVRHSYMEQNRVTDALATEAAKSKFLGRTTMLAVSPMFANDVFWTDILGTEVTRHFLACNIDILEQNMSVLGD
ncbi:hypothetical protein A4A49_57156, partial [Nicotiana attenuata]